MNIKFVTSRRYPFWASFGADESGAVLVELSLVLIPLFVFVVYATDFMLERLAEGQVQAALIAAAEFAQVERYCENGIKAAAHNAIGANNRWLAAITDDDISLEDPKCFGVAEGGLLQECGGGVTPANSCTGSCLESGESGALYGSITVTGHYSPIFPSWWSGLNSGSHDINDPENTTSGWVQTRKCEN